MSDRDAQYSDRARHCADSVNLHLQAIGFECVGKWVAVKLADGKSDGNLYDTREDAKRLQPNEKFCAYINIPPDGMTPPQAEKFLTYVEKLYAAGFEPMQNVDKVPIIPLEGL